ncbi:hypothetical protein ABIC10_008908 [Bradyrhizobium sp. S3.2.12]
MTAALRAPHSRARDAKRCLLASAARDSIHLHYSEVTDRTMEAHTQKQSDFQERQMPDYGVRCAVTKNGRRP